MPVLRVGDRAPDSTLQTLDGEPVALGDLRGRLALLVFLRHLG